VKEDTNVNSDSRVLDTSLLVLAVCVTTKVSLALCVTSPEAICINVKVLEILSDLDNLEACCRIRVLVKDSDLAAPRITSTSASWYHCK